MRVAEMACTFQRCYHAHFGDVVSVSEILCTFHNIVKAMTLSFGVAGTGEVWDGWRGCGGEKDGLGRCYPLDFLLELPTCS